MRAMGRASLASITTSSSAPWDPDEDEEVRYVGSCLNIYSECRNCTGCAGIATL